MLKRPAHLWLLTLTFVVGQWLAVVHGIQHQLNAGEQLVACEVCVAGHAAAGPPASKPALVLLPAEREAPTPALVARLPRDIGLLPPARGPPAHLV